VRPRISWVRGRLSRTFDWHDMAILSFEDGTKQCQRNATMTTKMIYFSLSLSSLTLAVTRLGRDAVI
jgi:hypothetical protein